MRLLAAAGALAGLLAAGAAPAQQQEEPPSDAGDRLSHSDGPAVVLDVPYLPQTPALCGGAAAAMVIRYWRGEGPEPEAFAGLVEDVPGGIRTTRLEEDLRRRGYRIRAFAGDRAGLRSQVRSGRPVVALLEVAPDRFHYVVVVSITAEGVLLHDPARAPYRFIPVEEFERRWEAAGSWAMLVLPGSDGGAGSAISPGGAASRDTSGRNRTGSRLGDRDLCAVLVGRGVERAREDRLAAAEEVLEGAASLCPDRASPWRELAGVRFRRGSWGPAGDAARQALRAAPGDEHSLRILAASRYLADDLDGALRAWNRLGQPPVSRPRVYGLQRAGYRSLMEHLGLPGEGLLTPGLLRRTRRRAESYPGFASSRVWYRPPPGRASSGLRVAGVERAGLPPGRVMLARWILRSVGARSVELDAGGPGEMAWSASVRPWSPYAEVSLTARAAGLLHVPGEWTVEGSWSRTDYGAPSAAGADTGGDTGAAATASTLPPSEERLAARLTWSRWLAADLRAGLGAGLYRWPSRGRSGALAASLGWRSPDDRISASAYGAGWTGAGEASSFARWGGSLSGRTSTDRNGAVASLRVGYEAATPGAPRSEWPGAGTGEARPHLLRAHPLLEEGALRGPVFGRRLAAAGAAVDYWRAGPGPLRIGLGAFADAARAWDRPGGPGPSPLHVDVGLGVRAAVGQRGGVFRLDWARGLRDGASALSLDWSPPWPIEGSCCGFP